MKNILYIANPANIHDLKWMSFFSAQKERFKCHLIYEKTEFDKHRDYSNKFRKYNIKLYQPIATFSLIRIFQTIKSLKRINNIIKENNIDLVHILFATPNAFWGLGLKTPYIITTRGSDILKVIPSLKEKKGLKSIYFNVLYYLLKKSFKKATLVTSTSTFQIEKIKSLYDIKSELIKTGVDVDFFKTKKINIELSETIGNNKIIFSPRFFLPIYNIELQVNALQFLNNYIIENYFFVFIEGKRNDFEYSKKIKGSLSALKQKNNLKYIIHNYLSQEEIAWYYQNSKLTIMTPLSDGTPNSAIESMICKCPLIISDLEHLDKEIFGDNIIKFVGGNPKKLADIIEFSLNNYPEKNLMNSFNIVNKLANRTSEMKKLERFYKKMI